jgi:lactoylglutathione lyase
MDHENYNVSDLEKSLAFYNEALGLTEVRRNVAKDGSYIIVYIANDTTDFQLELTWMRDHPQKYNLGECEFHLAFRVDDYEAAYQKHKEMDCICYGNETMGVYFITDPDGYWIEICPYRK